MAEENETLQEETETDYITALTQMRENTVPKEKYEKLREENSRLLHSLLNGETIEASDQNSIPNIDRLRKELYSGEVELTDIEYVSKTLELRDALIEKGERDPMLPVGHNIAPTPGDIEAANRTAKVMRECVEAANGDNSLFLSLLQRETMEVAIPQRKK